MDIKEVLESVKIDGIGLGQRFVKQAKQGDYQVITYNADGFTVEQKRLIEDLFNKELENKDLKGKFLLMSQSTQNQIEGGATKAKESANLKVGHAGPAKKRSIPSVKNIIAIASGKGGVGKSTFSSNLAFSLINAGHKVGLIDADIYGPSIPKILGSEGEKPTSNEKKKINPMIKSGLKYMSFGFFIENNDPVIWRGPMLGGVINQFLFDVDWGDLDYLIVDLPPGTGDVQLSLVQNVNLTGAVIISTPQDLALLDAKKGLNMFKKLDIPIIGLVENMSSFECNECGTVHSIFGNSGVEKYSSEENIKFLGRIPLSMGLRISADSGSPYMSDNSHKETDVYKSYTSIATLVDKSQSSKDNKKKGFFDRLLRR